MARREFSSKVRLAAFERAAGRCEKCGVHLTPGRFAYDHVIPDTFGGENTLENCQVLCNGCHGEKTSKADVPAYAKSQRIRKREAGIRKKSRLPGSRDSRFKKKIDGTVVPRVDRRSTDS